MAWSLQQLVMFEDTGGLVTRYWAPTELVYVGPYNRTKNQVVQEAESGVVKVLDLSDDETELYEFRVNRMPLSSRVEGAFTVQGVSGLLSFVQSIANYRGTAFDFWAPGAVKTDPATARVRYWGGTFRLDRVDGNGTERYGNGSQSIILRKEIT